MGKRFFSFKHSALWHTFLLLIWYSLYGGRGAVFDLYAKIFLVWNFLFFIHTHTPDHTGIDKHRGNKNTISLQ